MSKQRYTLINQHTFFYVTQQNYYIRLKICIFIDTKKLSVTQSTYSFHKQYSTKCAIKEEGIAILLRIAQQ